MSILGTRRNRFITLVAAVAVAAVSGGLAFAYWTSTGTGAGSAATGASTDFTVTSIAAVGPALTPGGAAQTVGFTVANASPGSLDLSSVVVTIANPDGTAWVAVPGCSAADYAIASPTIVYGQIAPGTGVDGTVTVAMNDLATNQDACKTVTVPLYFVAS